MPFLFPFEPDWGNSVQVEIAYKTEIIESRGYREQRLALRRQPRKTISFQVTALRENFLTFMRRVATQQQAEWVIPEITRAAETSATAFSGATSVQLGSAQPWASVGSWIVIRASSGLLIRQLTAVAGTVLSFAAPLPAALALGSEVYPGLIGRLSQSIRMKTPTNNIVQGTIELSADPGANVYEVETVAPLTFNGRELFLQRSNWGAVPSVDFEGFLETVDYGRGVVSHFIPVNWNVVKTQREYMLRGPDEANEFTAFLHRMKGQQGEFYTPSGSMDFNLSIGALATETILDVPGSEVFDLYEESPVHKAIWVRFSDGSWQANRVLSIAMAGPNSRITVLDPWDQDVSSDNARIVSWLSAYRLSVDTVSLDWLTRKVSRAKLTMQTVEDLA